MKDICVAAAVFRSIAGDIEGNLERMAGWVRQGKGNGADIVCFPELNVTGYAVQSGITADAALDVSNSAVEKIVQMAASENVAILAGMAEKIGNGIHASHVVATPDGLAGVYRKIHIAPPERAVFSGGNDIPIFEFRGAKFGIQLCYDAHFPELATAMALKGADILFMPHASPRGAPIDKCKSWMRHLTARAYDNSLFVVACNQTGENGAGLAFPGLALVLDPSGNILKQYLGEEEAVLVAELKSEDLDRVRNHRMRYFLPNRRPDLLRP